MQSTNQIKAIKKQQCAKRKLSSDEINKYLEKLSFLKTLWGCRYYIEIQLIMSQLSL